MRNQLKEAADGDHGFVGADLRTDPSALQAGVLSDGENLRMRNGVAGTRKGVLKPAWANITDSTTPTRVQAYPGTIYGVGTFKDPQSVEWHIIASAGQVYKLRPNNSAASMPLPTGVKILARCKPVQSFDKIYLFRGKDLQPLRCTDLSTGWVDLLARYDSTVVYAPLDEIAFGPQQTATLTRVSGTVTAVVTGGHGFVTGADVVVTGATEVEYNGRYNITVSDSTTFTYAFAGSATATATGAPKVSNMAYYWKALGSYPTLTTLVRKVQTGVGLVRVGTVVTATLVTHGFANGDTITIAGANEVDYNGAFLITNVTANTFDYSVFTAPATPATGTITARTWKIAVATTATAHGFANGNSVTIDGAVPAVFNVTRTISAVTATTFEVTIPSDPLSDATGTMHARNNTKVVLAQTPDTNPEAWTRIYNILPNADDGLYVNNRVLVATAYAPGGSSYGAASNYSKKDYVVATDFLDELHFDFADEFRINQGSNDELVELQKFGDDLVLCFKDSSWAVLANVNFNLANVALDIRGREYGLACRGASVSAGTDVYFLAQNRGVCSIRQTELGKVQGVDLPLSDEIQPLIDRINWNYARTKARMAYWENRLYVAVPVDDATTYGPNLVTGNYHAGDGMLTLTVQPGQTYYYSAGNSKFITDSRLQFGTLFQPAGVQFNPGYFTTTSTTLYVWAAPGYISAPFGPGGTPIASTASVRAAYRNCNNTILIYDFLNKKWTPRDTGGALSVRDFYKAQFNGKERLFFTSEDNYVNLMEECDAGDQIASTTSSTGLTFQEITSRWRTRAYPAGNQRNLRPVELLATLATWNPTYTATLIYDGAGERQTLDANAATSFTRNRLKYVRPWTATDWDPTNANNDHATPWRQDYSVPISTSGLYLLSGIQTDLHQETPIRMGATPREGRGIQVEISNTQGRAQLKAVELTVIKQPRRKEQLAV